MAWMSTIPFRDFWLSMVAASRELGWNLQGAGAGCDSWWSWWSWWWEKMKRRRYESLRRIALCAEAGEFIDMEGCENDATPTSVGSRSHESTNWCSRISLGNAGGAGRLGFERAPRFRENPRVCLRSERRSGQKIAGQAPSKSSKTITRRKERSTGALSRILQHY